MARPLPTATLQRRIGELDALHLQRRLTASEQAEADRLTDRLYMRLWRASLAEQTARVA